MNSADDVREVIREELGRHLEAYRDLRSEILSLALIYPLDQHHLKSGFVGQNWMLKLCCMYPGEEHTLEGGDGENGTETNPALGVYRLKDLGEFAAPVIKWMSGKSKILKSSPLGWAAFSNGFTKTKSPVF
ncbi:MAG: hypothetical protein JST85_18120 [Acidobacteria bacterium]|nr:hypothetical protein [Acidobacteriota bacterium]